jgi:hypothetical protein
MTITDIYVVSINGKVYCAASYEKGERGRPVVKLLTENASKGMRRKVERAIVRERESSGG